MNSNYRVKRETGEKPVRSRHCKLGVWSGMHKHDHWETGKIGAYVERKSGNLPVIWYRNIDSRSRVIGRTVFSDRPFTLLRAFFMWNCNYVFVLRKFC